MHGTEKEFLILKNKNSLITIHIDQIVKIKKQFPLLQPLGFLPLAAGVLVYLNSTNQLYLGPLSFYLLGASIIYRVTFDSFLNPKKIIAPGYWKGKNRWELKVFDE